MNYCGTDVKYLLKYQRGDLVLKFKSLLYCRGLLLGILT